MKIVGRDGDAVLVDLQREWRNLRLACVVRDNGEVSPALPLAQFLEAGIYDQPVVDGFAVLAKVRDAKPRNGIG